ncbi:MAG: 2-oxoacid:acceptor oxidoreductase subunit alpha [Anaerolineaceae bacterium]
MIMSEANCQDGMVPIVNEFCMTICSVNGSGSATANSTLYGALFKMGIPTSGKNIFPSNIKGLPTWFVIRASEKGYIGRVPYDDIIVAMNPETFLQDLTYLPKGGVIFYADHIQKPEDARSDLIFYPMPIRLLLKQADVPRNLRDYMENMTYVGIVGQVLGITLESIEYALGRHFASKPAALESNLNMIKTGYEWAAGNLEKRDCFHVRQLPPLDDCILTDGNNAGGLGALFGGAEFCSWYPITPSTSMVEAMIAHAPSLRKDPISGKNTCVILQVEDELAAAGAAIGAGWAGLRAMTSTSGPGLSLMTENVGLAYFTETPIVIWDVQRVGPSTGLPTRTAQGDLSMIYYLGHGDVSHVLFIPGSVNECFEFGWKSFDVAERYQTPVFVLSDLDLGMNQWITRKFEYPDRPMDRGKVLWEDDLAKFEGKWGRYLDADGDGIPYRTVMGNQNPAAPYFTRGTGHDVFGSYSEDPKNWADLLLRLKRKLENVTNDLPEPMIRNKADAKIGLIGMGSTEPALIEAQDLLAEAGINADFLRIRSLPCHADVHDFIDKHEVCYVLELNRDGQLCSILKLEVSEHSHKLFSITDIGGFPMTAIWAKEQVLDREQKRNG